MATRRQIQQRRAALRAEIERKCRAEQTQPGSLLPPVRELAGTYDLSPVVVRQVLRSLGDEGVLYTVPRVGTYIGRRISSATEFYLLYLPTAGALEGAYLQLRIGFEERIARFGGASLLLTPDADDSGAYGAQPTRLAGVLDFEEAPFRHGAGSADSIPRVRFAGSKRMVPGVDLVSFDDEDGGRLAARHLLALGHRCIAFLGLHREGAAGGVFAWSAERERGWRQALVESGLPAERLAYHVAAGGEFDQMQAAREAAAPLVRRPDITAVVTANDLAARGLIEALKDAEVPSACWPAIVGFDEDPSMTGYNLSSCRLPWDEVGRAAAELLWQRRQGGLVGPPVHRQVPMQLIQRITCRVNWPLASEPAVLATLDAST